jgi:2,3,4,5-tetrahydropyridine-2-carboxylate N-succinyltransferase
MTRVVPLEQTIAEAFSDPTRVRRPETHAAVEAAIGALDRGEVRLAEPRGEDWVVHAWVQQAILLYFRIKHLQTWQVGQFEYHDKLPLKHDYARIGVRVVPPAAARYGSHLEPGVILMPSYVNIGAWVGSGTLVDTWATVGSGAQIGRDVHLAGGVGIGGVLEPPGARPVIVEDGAFIGSRCIITEGVRVEQGAVLAANVALTASTKIIDVTGPEPVTYEGRVPARSVVVPGTRARAFPAGEYQVSCALIVGQRSASTDRKTALNEALRDFGLA